MEKVLESPIKLTDSALEQLKRIKQEEGIDEDHFLRIGVKGGGCAGFTYILGFDHKKDDDEIFQFEDVAIVINPAHSLYLVGMEIDWLDGLNNRGFQFNNPNAEDTCGCGTSFSA